MSTCIKWAAPCENESSGICGQRRPRSGCTSAQSDQGLRRPFTESLDTFECINGEKMPGSDIAHAWVESESVQFAHARRHFRLALPVSFHHPMNFLIISAPVIPLLGILFTIEP